MSEIYTETEVVMYKDIQTEGGSLPESLRKQLLYPDGWIKENEAVKFENEWLMAEREEIVSYVKTLKMLSLYLTGKTSIPREELLGNYFAKAEQNFPEHLRSELEISI
jgi:hypothetical protein